MILQGFTNDFKYACVYYTVNIFVNPLIPCHPFTPCPIAIAKGRRVWQQCSGGHGSTPSCWSSHGSRWGRRTQYWNGWHHQAAMKVVNCHKTWCKMKKFKIFGLVASRWRQFGLIFGIHCLIAVLLPHLTFQTYTCGSRLWHQRTMVTGIHCSRSQFSIYPAVRICMTLVYPVLVLRTLTMQAHQNGAVNCKRPQFKRDSDMSKGVSNASRISGLKKVCPRLSKIG